MNILRDVGIVKANSPSYSYNIQVVTIKIDLCKIGIQLKFAESVSI